MYHELAPSHHGWGAISLSSPLAMCVNALEYLWKTQHKAHISSPAGCVQLCGLPQGLAKLPMITDGVKVAMRHRSPLGYVLFASAN